MQTTSRHGFLLPEISDDDPTPNAGVRDSFRFNAGLSDRSAFFDYDETITGKWNFQSIVLTSGLTQDLVNNTGGARVTGDVIMLDPAVDRSALMPTAAIAGPRVGVVTENIAAGAIGRVAFEGFVRVKVAGATRLQYLQTQAASVIAVGSATPSTASFAILLENPAAGTALAYLHPGSGTDAESSYKGTTLRSNAAAVTSAELVGKLYYFGFRASAQTVNLPDPTLSERPITIAAELSQINMAVDGGTTVVGGSTNQVTGAIQNGVVAAGDAFTYKSNGTQWRAV
jgi:hypothetical protein